MCEVAIQTAEPVSTREATDRMVKILDINYENADLEQVAANATHLNAEDRTQQLCLIKYFEDLFDGTIGLWDTDTIDPELKTDSKPFNCIYYLYPLGLTSKPIAKSYNV